MAKKKTGKEKTRIDADMVRRVAKNARLELTDSEIKKFSKDLNDILAAFAVLDNVKTTAKMTAKGRQVEVKPSFQPLPIKDIMRDDAEEKCLTQEKALANTKHKEKGFFKGPRVV